MSIPGVLGTRGKRYFNAYAISGGVATWSCYYGSPSATQSTASHQPTAKTLAGGMTYPFFNGAVSAYSLLACASAMSTPPTFASTNSYLYGYLEQIVSIPNAIAVLLDINSSGGIADGCLSFSNGNGVQQLYAPATTDAYTTAAQDDNVMRRILVHYNGSTGVTTIYANGVAQTHTGSSQLGKYWKTNPMSFGTQPSVTTRCVQGGMAALFCAVDTSPFSSTDLSNLDNELFLLTQAVALTTTGTPIAGAAAISTATLRSFGALSTLGTPLAGAAAVSSATLRSTGSLSTSSAPIAAAAAVTSGAITSTGRLGATLVAGAAIGPAPLRSPGALSTSSAPIAATAGISSAQLLGVGHLDASIACSAGLSTGAIASPGALSTSGTPIACAGAIASATLRSIGALSTSSAPVPLACAIATARLTSFSLSATSAASAAVAAAGVRSFGRLSNASQPISAVAAVLVASLAARPLYQNVIQRGFLTLRPQASGTLARVAALGAKLGARATDDGLVAPRVARQSGTVHRPIAAEGLV